MFRFTERSPGFGHTQTVPIQIRRRRPRRLTWICTVYASITALFELKQWLIETVLSPRSGPFYQPPLRDNQPTSHVCALIFTAVLNISIIVQAIRIKESLADVSLVEESGEPNVKRSAYMYMYLKRNYNQGRKDALNSYGITRIKRRFTTVCPFTCKNRFP